MEREMGEEEREGGREGKRERRRERDRIGRLREREKGRGRPYKVIQGQGYAKSLYDLHLG